ARNNQPLQQGRKASPEYRKNRHRRGIGPAPPDLDIEPLTENGIGGAKNDRGKSHAPAEGGPVEKSGHRGGHCQNARGDQTIAASGMNERGKNLARRADAPQSIKR